jgi:hypothetical protein
MASGGKLNYYLIFHPRPTDTNQTLRRWKSLLSGARNIVTPAAKRQKPAGFLTQTKLGALKSQSTMPQPNYSVISAQDFNTIPDIHDQVDIPNDPALFAALGKTFRKYDVHKRFGLHLLHRHFDLPEGCIMLKSNVDTDISLTTITHLDLIEQSPIRGVLYFLNDAGSFQAYEFEHGDALDISSTFLEELSEILHKFKMEKVIALDTGAVHASRDNFPNFEYVVGDTATVTVRVDKKVESHHRQTGFTFLENEGEILHQFGEVYAEKKNTHQVFYDAKCRLPKEPGLKIDPSEVRRILVLNSILAY